MKTYSPIILTFLLMQLLLTACSQEKVMDTESIRLQNKVKDLENALKQREDEAVKITQKLTDMEKSMTEQGEQITRLMEASKEIQQQEIHPVIIQDVKITSESMDASGRLWGSFNLNVTLYNGTETDISDYVSVLLIADHPSNANQSPQVESLVQKFELKAKESRIITFSGIPVNDPAKRLNAVIKLLEQTPSPANLGVPGKATWVVVPTTIFPPR